MEAEDYARAISTLELHLETEAALQDDRPLRALMEAWKFDAFRALDEFAEANPADTAAVICLQARVKCYIFAYKVFRDIANRGRAAELALQDVHTQEALRDEIHDD
jgi:hypothetical protein